MLDNFSGLTDHACHARRTETSDDHRNGMEEVRSGRSRRRRHRRGTSPDQDRNAREVDHVRRRRRRHGHRLARTRRNPAKRQRVSKTTP